MYVIEWINTPHIHSRHPGIFYTILTVKEFDFELSNLMLSLRIGYLKINNDPAAIHKEAIYARSPCSRRRREIVSITNNRENVILDYLYVIWLV